jgi:uncharacterized protein
VRIAVVGSGISGLSAAWLLGKRHDVVLYEASGRLGGHSNTVDVSAPEGNCPIDTGFIVYNTAAYPNLISFLEILGVETAPSDMSFRAQALGGYSVNLETSAGLVTGAWFLKFSAFSARRKTRK